MRNVATITSDSTPELLYRCMKYYYSMPENIKMSAMETICDMSVDIRKALQVSRNIETVWRNFMTDRRYRMESLDLFRSDAWKLKSASMQIELEMILKSPSYDAKTYKDTIMLMENEISKIYAIYSPQQNYQTMWRFLKNLIISFIEDKEQSYRFYLETFGDDDVFKVDKSPNQASFSHILQEYLFGNKADKRENFFMFYASIYQGMEDIPEKNLLTILDELVRLYPDVVERKPYTIPNSVEYIERVSILESVLASNNIGQVNIFGSNIFSTDKMNDVKNDILTLDRETISEFFPKKEESMKIIFDIPSDTKVMLREELSPKMCSAQVMRGKEIDNITLIEYESKAYLLFRKMGNTRDIYGISLMMDDSTRELINISGDSEFSYRLIIDDKDFVAE